MPIDLIVTRHPALLALARERGLVHNQVPVLTHVDHVSQIADRHVLGVLPLHLAAAASSVTEIPLTLTAEDRGRELDLDRLRLIAGPARTYVVHEVPTR